MNTDIYNTYEKVKVIIWDNEILNHYINNFAQHLYYEEKKKEVEVLYTYLLNIFDDLKYRKTKQSLFFYLKENYDKNEISSVKVLKNYYIN